MSKYAEIQQTIKKVASLPAESKLFVLNEEYKGIYEPYLWTRRNKVCSDFLDKVRQIKNADNELILGT